MSVVGARAALVLADEIFLAVHQRAAFVVARMMDVRAVGLHVPGGRGVGHLQVHIANQLVDLLGRGDADQRLDAAVEVAVAEPIHTSGPEMGPSPICGPSELQKA